MAKNFNKFFFNNLKETTYLSNIERVEFDSTKTDSNDMLSDEQLRNRREFLDNVQLNLRHKNLRVYMKNMISLKVDRFFTFVVPTALLVGTVASFLAPYNRVVDHKFSHVFVKESTILSDTEGQILDNSEIYYYDSNLFSADSFKFVKENEYNYTNRENDYLTYQMSDGIDSVLTKFAYNSEGKLTFNNVDIGNYIDLSDYDFSEATLVDEKYEMLFDEVLRLIMSEEDISSDIKAKLEAIANSENRKIIIDIVKYENIGSGVTEIYKNRFWQRLILLMGTWIWLGIIFIFYKNDDLFKATKLYVDDAELCASEKQIKDFWHVGLKYKEAFIRAENERIRKARELAQEYVSDDDVNDLFTSFEKKLVLGESRER